MARRRSGSTTQGEPTVEAVVRALTASAAAQSGRPDSYRHESQEGALLKAEASRRLHELRQARQRMGWAGRLLGDKDHAPASLQLLLVPMILGVVVLLFLLHPDKVPVTYLFHVVSLVLGYLGGVKTSSRKGSA